MNFRNVLVTGANRGIGLEFIKQFVSLESPPNNIIATTRNDSEALNELKTKHSSIHVLKYDSLDHKSLDAFYQNVNEIVGDEGLDLLVNNAGLFIRDNLETVNQKDLMTTIETNAVAPIMLSKTLLPILTRSADKRKTVIAMITSLMGSIDDNTSGAHYGYRSSKTALNMMSRSLALDVKHKKVIVLLLHPGWVQTDMGTDRAPTTPETSVKGMLNIIRESNLEKTGEFVNFLGNKLAW